MLILIWYVTWHYLELPARSQHSSILQPQSLSHTADEDLRKPPARHPAVVWYSVIQSCPPLSSKISQQCEGFVKQHQTKEKYQKQVFCSALPVLDPLRWHHPPPSDRSWCTESRAGNQPGTTNPVLQPQLLSIYLCSWWYGGWWVVGGKQGAYQHWGRLLYQDTPDTYCHNTTVVDTSFIVG